MIGGGGERPPPGHATRVYHQSMIGESGADINKGSAMNHRDVTALDMEIAVTRRQLRLQLQWKAWVEGSGRGDRRGTPFVLPSFHCHHSRPPAPPCNPLSSLITAPTPRCSSSKAAYAEYCNMALSVTPVMPTKPLELLCGSST